MYIILYAGDSLEDTSRDVIICIILYTGDSLEGTSRDVIICIILYTGDSLEGTSRDVRIVTSKWLTLCLERKSLVDSAPFQIDRPAENSPHELLSYPNSLQPSKVKVHYISL